MRRFLRDNGLGLAFGVAFVLALAGQAVAGHAEFLNQLAVERRPPISFGAYLTSADFVVDVTENWQSEYLQFFLYIYATVWLVQRGSPESKRTDRAGPEADEQQLTGAHARADSPRWARVGGWRGALYGHSLGLVMGVVFVLSWLAQSLSGVLAYNERQRWQHQPQVTWVDYLTSAEFWSRSVQNWQSELLAIASMVLLSIFLRQRGSPESKPVGAPHGATAVEG